MKTIDLLCVLIPLILGITCFASTNSLIFTILLSVISFLYFYLLFKKRFSIFVNKIARFKECNKFINDFIVCLTIKKSLVASFETIESSASDLLFEELKTMKDMNEIEKLSYLCRYFPFDSYKLFVDLVVLWSEQGGDMLELSKNLLNQLKEEMDYLVFSENCSKRKTIEFVSLWLISFLVLFVLRFSLTDFYYSLSNQLIYQLGIFSVLFIALISIELLLRSISKIEIKGWNNEIK